jgi:hypothetical protein
MTLDNDLAGANAPSPSSFLSHASFSQLLALMATVVVILVAQYVRSPWRKVPPGPKGLPILGNALQLQNKDWMYGAECKRKFGSSDSVVFADFMTLRIYNTTLRTYNVYKCAWPAHCCFT